MLVPDSSDLFVKLLVVRISIRIRKDNSFKGFGIDHWLNYLLIKSNQIVV